MNIAPLETELLIELIDPPDSRPTGASSDFWRSHLAALFGVTEHMLTIDAVAGRPPIACVDGAKIPVSFSRSAGVRACAARRKGPVGVDIERVASFPELEQMIDIALSPEEIQWCMNNGPVDRSAAFLKLWTLKEAVLKAAGTGLKVDPRQAGIDLGQTEQGTASIDGNRFLTFSRRIDQLVIAIAIPAPHCSEITRVKPVPPRPRS